MEEGEGEGHGKTWSQNKPHTQKGIGLRGYGIAIKGQDRTLIGEYESSQVHDVGGRSGSFIVRMVHHLAHDFADVE